MDKKVKKTLESLKANNIEAFYAEKRENVADIVKSLLNKGDIISCGGSVTLSQCGVLEVMRNGDYVFLDRDEEGLTRDDIMDIYRKTFSADAFITSANAVTEKGELVNVDGNGNRVSAITFGPKKVICVVGANKIVEDVKEGFRRVKTVAAPQNAVRLNVDTPCKKFGHCICPEEDIANGCNSPERLCAHYVVTGHQRNKDRIKVILCSEELGY